MDENEASQNSVSWVLRKLATPRDTVHLIHVVALEKTISPLNFSPGGLQTEMMPMLDKELRQIEEEKSRAYLEKATSKCSEAGVLVISRLVVEHTWETVATALCDVAEELQADVLVVARSGKSFVREALQGSLTNYLVHHCCLPVLCIPPNIKEE
jgi:nucleotide-binding universal stress UspA family protein